MNDLIRILVVGAQTVERKGLSSILNNLPSLVVVGEAASGQEAALMARESRPDIIILDGKWLHKEGSASIWRIWQENSNMTVMVLNNPEVGSPIMADYTAGKLYFIDKDAAPEEMSRIIEEVVYP